MVEVKEIDLLKEGTLLPPAPDVCQVCATKHDPELPHNHTSLYYQYSFKKQHDRWPTLEDAMAHCTEDMKSAWREAVKQVEQERSSKCQKQK